MDRNRGFDINALRQQLEDLFEDFFPAGGSRRPSGGRGDQAQHLPVNLVESEDAYVLTAPLPGFEPDDIEINVRGQNLSLRAQRKNPPSERPNSLRREWGFGPFHRSVDLPGHVDAEHASAGFKHGVVTITIPKEERPQSIPVEDADEEAHGTQAPERTETPETSEPTLSETETTVSVTETPETGTDAEAGESEAHGGRSFYMRPAQGGRRHGRGQRGSRPAPVAAPETVPEAAPEPTEAVEEEPSTLYSAEGETPEAPAEEAIQVPEHDDMTDAETETGAMEPEAEAQAAVGEETERSQEPGTDDESPVPHTTTASDESVDLSEQRGPSTDAEDETESTEPMGDEVTDEQDARLSQTTNEPTD